MKTLERGVAVGLRWPVAGTVHTVPRSEKLEQAVTLIDADHLSLTGNPNELLAGER